MFFTVSVFLVDKAPPWCCPPFLDPLPSTARSVPLCPLRHVKRASFLPESQSPALRSLHLSLDAGSLGSRTTGSRCPSQLRAPRCFLLPLWGHRAQASGHLFSSSTLEAAMPAGVPRRCLETLCHTWGQCCRHRVGQGQKSCHQHPTGHTTALHHGAPSVSRVCPLRSPVPVHGFKSFCVQMIEPKIYMCNPNHPSNLNEHLPTHYVYLNI